MKMKKYLVSVSALMLASGALAQDLNTEITVNHEIVPEEKAATRMRWLPTISLPAVNAGRLPAYSTFMPGTLTPYIMPLSAAQYADTAVCSPWRGYAVLGYGPAYNLAASAGYNFINREDLTVNGFMQFDGMRYTSKYPGINYDGKVNFHRNTALVGGNAAYNISGHNLSGDVIYQYSGYNFPVLDLPTLKTDKYFINANLAKVNVGWSTKLNKVDLRAMVNYGMIYFGKDMANNNRVALKSGLSWYASTKSTWLFDFNFSIDHSSLVGNKNIVELHPAYQFANRKFRLKFGIDFDVPRWDSLNEWGFLLVPELYLDWTPSQYFGLWLHSTWDLVDNNRLSMYDEQPYLMADFDADEISGIWKLQLGFVVGPFRGAALRLYTGPNIAPNWYIPAVQTGYMRSNDIGGWLWGAAFSYDYRRYLSLNVTGEYAPHKDGDYDIGYAPWRDHARYNLLVQATVHPIEKLDITLGYHLRGGREKMLADDKDMKLRTISNLQAGAAYRITPQWSAFVRGENLLNKHWYLGPAVPSQGIMGLIGATYKF